MSDEWDTVTKIGSKTRGGAGAPKEKVIRGESALNAARRTGAAIATEKKFAVGNTVSFFGLISCFASVPDLCSRFGNQQRTAEV